MNNIAVIRQVFDPNRRIEVPLLDVTTVPLINRAKKKDTVIYTAASAELVMGQVQEWVRLKTLEGHEAMPDDAWMIVGVNNEPWFIDPYEIWETYRPIGPDLNRKGWTLIVPLGAVRETALLTYPAGFAIYGEYGEIREGTNPVNGKDRWIMFSKGPASFVVHDPGSPSNYWLVEPTIYEKSYESAIVKKKKK